MLKEELEYKILELSENLPHSRGTVLPEIDGYSREDVLEHIKSLVERRLVLAIDSKTFNDRTLLVKGLTASGHGELKSRRLTKRPVAGPMARIDWKWGIGLAILAATAIILALYL
jgi:hypothetical protein